MNGTEFHIPVVGVLEVETGALARLVGVVDRWADGNGGCCAGVRAAEIESETLEGVGAHIVLIYNCDIARWAFRSL